jgi:hypothetical protein
MIAAACMAFFVLAGLGILAWLFFAVVAVVVFVFWLMMLISAIQNPRLSGTEKVIWVLVIVFLHFLGALIYFFLGKRKA